MNNKSIGRILMMPFALLLIFSIYGAMVSIINMQLDMITVDTLIKIVSIIIVFGIIFFSVIGYEIYNK